MRIYLINQYFPPDTAATGQYLADVARALAGSGHEVHVICSQRTYSGGRGMLSSPKGGEYRVHRVAATGCGRMNLLGRLLDYLSFYVLALWKSLSLSKADVVVCLSTPPFVAVIGVLLSRLRGTRLVVWVMDLYPEVFVAFGVLKQNGLLYRFLRWVSAIVYQRAVGIISLGEVMRKRLVEAGAEERKIVTVHNWVPREAVHYMECLQSPMRQEWALNGHVALVYSGNLGLGHELDTVIRAYEKLGKGTSVRLVFVGSGKMRETLERYVAEHGLDGVKFRRSEPLDRLSALLGAGDIHLVAQRSGTEGLIVPSKIYGILAAGRPTIYIGPDDTEVAMILRDSGAGIIIAPGDVEGAAKAIEDLANDWNNRQEMGRRALEWYTGHFGMARSVDVIVDLVKSVACRQGKDK